MKVVSSQRLQSLSLLVMGNRNVELVVNDHGPLNNCITNGYTPDIVIRMETKRGINSADCDLPLTTTSLRSSLVAA